MKETSCNHDGRKIRVIISERSFLSNDAVFIDLLGDGNFISEIDRHLLKIKSMEFFQALEEDYHLRPIFIRIKDEPENSLRRVKERNRHGEEGIDLAYLQSLDRKYDNFYKTVSYPSYSLHLNEFLTQKESKNKDSMVDLKGLVKSLKEIIISHHLKY